MSSPPAGLGQRLGELGQRIGEWWTTSSGQRKVATIAVVVVATFVVLGVIGATAGQDDDTEPVEIGVEDVRRGWGALSSDSQSQLCDSWHRGLEAMIVAEFDSAPPHAVRTVLREECS